ncbi:MAG TPA: amino acid adenylation domain-containing protein, partial [Pyrinomonadaceae bacterium]
EQARTPAVLPELELQYADYAIWQRGWLQGEALESQLRYWKKQLAGATTLELPADRVRPALPTHRGGAHPFTLGRDLTDRLSEVSRRERATLFMTLLAAFQALLARYSGQNDIVVGTPIAGRTQRELEPLIGFFLNTLVLRSEVNPNQSFAELLAHVRNVCLGAYAHQDLPFEKLIDELQPERDLSRTPLFQVMFTLQNAPAGELDLPGLSFGGGQTEGPTEQMDPMARFDLILLMTETPSGLTGSWLYSRDLFDADRIARASQHLQQLCAAAVRDTTQRLWELPLLSEAERAQLRTWNDTSTAYPQHVCIHELFAAQVERTPDDVALVFEEEELTYSELNRRANQLGHYLRGLEVGPEVIVGICLERSIEMVVGLLGILKAGGAYLPLDPEYPQERIEFMIGESGIRLLLTQAKIGVPAGAEACGLTVVSLDADWEKISAAPETDVVSGATAENLAYVIYTSGSTGKPKGSMLQHRGVCNRLLWMQDTYQLKTADAVLQKTPFSFDVSVWEFFWPLLTGARLVLAQPEGHRDAEYLTEVIKRERITVLHFVPSMLQAWLASRGGPSWPPAGDSLMNEGAAPRNDDEECESLRLVVCSGEALSAELQRRFVERMPWVELENLYGPTEASVDVTRWRCGKEAATVVPIGHPVWNTQMYVLGRELELLPVGVVGELYIGGVQLARGYLDRPELTAERFIPHPYSSEGGARLYRTGDLGRYLANGAIEYVGRTDDQVKIRGFRIELGEIALTLEQHPGVTEAVVLAREDAPGEKRLVAYVIGDCDTNELRDYARERLPEYMTPAAIVRLEQWPLNANGKLDRRALPAPEWNLLAQTLNFVPPRTEVQATFARIWAEVLRLERVGIHDNFFDLGGDSILSIQIIARAVAAGLRVTTKQMFQHQTIASLAQVVEFATNDDEAIWAEQGTVTGPVALTPIQHQFFEQERANPNHLNHAVMLRLSADTRVDFLRVAIETLLVHHDALRLRFQRNEDGHWQQFNAGITGGPYLTELDLSALTARAGAIGEASEQIQRSLSLTDGPLMRAVVMRPGAGEELVLLLVIHHLAVDGVSWRVLLEDLQTAYEQARRGSPPHLPAKTTSFQQWAALLLEYAASDRLLDDTRYWQEQPWEQAARLPLDHEDGTNRHCDERQVSVLLSKEDTASLLQEVPTVYRTRIQELLLTALTLALTDWTGNDAVVIEQEGHGREETIRGADLTRTVGWFTTIYPVLLSRLAGAETGAQIKNTKEQLRAVPEGGLSFGVRRYLRREESITAARGEVLFNYLGQLDQVLGPDSSANHATTTGRLIAGMAAENSGDTSDPEAQQEYLLRINSAVAGGQLGLRLSYSGEQFDTATMERVVERFKSELLRIIQHCREEGAGGRTPSDFPLAQLSQAEVDRVAGDGRAIEDIYPATSLQVGMLYQSLMDQQSSGLFGQSNYLIEGGLEVAAFLAAAQEVVDRHPILRTSFVWEGVSEPLQVVHRKLALPVVQYDWRELSPDERQQRWDSLRAEDQESGFDMAQAPLMRVVLARVAAESHWLMWSHHHLLLDGWCVPLLMKDVFAAYERQCGVASAPEISVSRPYRDYVAWLQQQDLSKAENYWRETLRGFKQPTVLPFTRPQETLNDAPQGDLPVSISRESSKRLQERARREQVTMHTVFVAAWALLLARLSGTTDVVFGTTVSGRPPELPGVEEMIGLFINTLPVRVRVNEERSNWEWLRELQDEQLEMRQYEYSPLMQVQQWSEVGAGRALFDTMLIYENYPIERQASAGVNEGVSANDALRMRKVTQPVRTKYPLNLIAGVGDELFVYLTYDRRRFADEQMAVLSEQFAALLDQFAAATEWSIGEALVSGEWEQRARAEYETVAREGDARREAETASLLEQPVLELVRKAVGEVLGVEVSNEDNFFELGGHSLMATQLVSRLREIFAIELPLRRLFEIPTVALLAQYVEAELREAAGVPAPPLRRFDRGNEAPLSFAQQRLWFLDQLEPDNPFYNTPVAVKLQGALNERALEQTFTEIVRRHEVLRTSFVNVDGRAVQVIAEPRPIELRRIDLSEVRDQQAVVKQLATEESLEPFELSRGPLLRLKLVRLAADEHVVFLTMHHIISDGWSTGVLINEVATLYRAFCEQLGPQASSPAFSTQATQAVLPELPVQYADYAIWQRDWLQGEALAAQMSYWEEQLRGAELVELPVDRLRPAQPSHRGARHAFAFTEELSGQLKELSRREGVTLYMTTLAAFQALLSRYSGQKDIVVGSVIAGRNRQEIEPLIGLFINTLALRTNLSGEPTFRELLRRVREVCLGAYAHQDVPFEKIVEELGQDRDLGRSPFFEITFGLQNSPQGTLELPDLQLQPLGTEIEQARFDLTVWLLERDGKLWGTMTYNTDILDEETVRTMQLRYQTLLESIVRDPNARLSALEMISAEEKEEKLSRKQKRRETHLEKLKSIKRRTATTPPVE